MTDKIQARLLIEQEVQAIYARQQQGLDVSPGQRLRLEGKVELLLQWQLIDWQWLQAFVSEQYQYFFQQTIADDYWLWLQDVQRFHLPVRMQDAPVYKG